MTPILIVILVVTLLLPGLAMLFAVVLRFLFRGTQQPTEPANRDDPTEVDPRKH